MDMDSAFSLDGDGDQGRFELDTHADTTAAGNDMLLLDDMEKITQFVDVAPFADSYEAIKNVPIGTCAAAYDCVKTGTVYILVFGQVLYFGDQLGASLVCPNQVRAAGNLVEDCPRQYDPSSQHGITVKDI